MSEFGFRVSASDGTIAVSEKTYNPVYIGDATPVRYDEGPLYAQTDYYLSRVWFFSVKSTEQPIPFLVPYNGEVLSLIQVKNLGGGNWEIIIGQGVRTSPPRVLCFAKSDIHTATGHGFAIWDGSGKLCFDSNKNHLLVDAIGTSPPLSQACSPKKGSNQSYYTSFPMGNSTAPLSSTVSSPAFFAGTISFGGCYYENGGSPFYGLGFRAFRIQNGNSVFSAWAAAWGGLGSGQVGFFNNTDVYVAVTDASRYG